MNEDAVLFLVVVNFIVIILAVALKSKLKGTKYKIAMVIVTAIIVVSGIVWRLLHGGF